VAHHTPSSLMFPASGEVTTSIPRCSQGQFILLCFPFLSDENNPLFSLYYLFPPTLTTLTSSLRRSSRRLHRHFNFLLNQIAPSCFPFSLARACLHGRAPDVADSTATFILRSSRDFFEHISNFLRPFQHGSILTCTEVTVLGGSR
jgi:hypothetical protein